MTEQAQTQPSTPLRAVALPTEHGGWSLTLEPALLGMLVAPSMAGLWLSLAALLSFVARTPLKLALVDRWRRRRLPRTVLAERTVVVEIIVLAVVFAAALAIAESPFWWPLLIAAPLVVIELWYDMRSRSRRLLPELLGAIGIGSVVAIVVLADGRTNLVAVGLWCVVGARSIAAIPFVRVQLRRAKGQRSRLWTSDLAQVIAVAAVAIAWLLDAVPLTALGAVLVLGLVHAALSRRPTPAVAVIGAQQVVLGLLVVIATAAAGMPTVG